MFDRVAAALALVMLVLFSATVALARCECCQGEAHSQVSMEHQAEEVLDADLEVVFQLVVVKDVNDGEHVNDCETVSDVACANARHPDTKAVGAAGVYHSVVTGDYNDVHFGTVINEDDGIIGREIGSGRFAGAAA